MLGIHSQVYVTDATRACLPRAGIVKAIDNVGLLQAAKPTAIKIARHYFTPYEQAYQPDAYGQGHWCADRVIASLGGYKDPRLILEPFNEAGLNLDFLRGFADACHLWGYLAGGPCLGTGNLEKADVEALTTRNWCGLDLLLLHGYWGRFGPTTWNALRHRLIAEWSGGSYPPIIYTEAGRDAIEGGQAGWRKCGLSENQYRAELLAYGLTLKAERAAGYKVLGSTPFTFGPNRDWTAFDMEPFADCIGDWEPEWSLLNPTGLAEGGTMPIARIGNGYEVIDLRGALPHPSAYPRRPRSAIKYIVVHHSAVTGDQTALQTAQYHIERNGWPGIGYQFGVHADGKTEMYHDIEEASYNVAYRNHECLGVILYGDWSESPPGQKQLEAARRLCAELQYDLGDFIPIVGHREIATAQSPTSCPGNSWPAWKAKVITNAAPAQPPATDWQAVANEYKRRLEQIAGLAKV